MGRIFGVFILAVMVALLGHPAVALPPMALVPLLAMLLPVVSFCITVAPEPELCQANLQVGQPRDAKCERRHPLQL